MFWGKLGRIPAIGFSVATLDALAKEGRRARAKFPTNRPLAIACTEELGELVKALSFYQFQPGPGTRLQVEREAVQLASTALRIYEEGDATFDELTRDECKP